MGILDAFSKEDRTEITFSTFYSLMRESAKCELLMNAVRCNVPHKHIREMATGENEDAFENENKEPNTDNPSENRL